MKKTKKIISLFLTIQMLLACVVPGYALADDRIVQILPKSEETELIDSHVTDEITRNSDGELSTELIPLAATECYYETENAAMRAAKQSVNIPLSANYDSITTDWVLGSNQQYYQSITYIYGDKFIRHDGQGHYFNDGFYLNRHYNSGRIVNGRYINSGFHFFY